MNNYQLRTASIGLLIFFCSTALGQNKPVQRPRYVGNELLVKRTAAGTASQIVVSPQTVVGAAVLRAFPVLGWEQVRLPAGMTVRQGIQAYQALPGVIAAEPNYTIEPTGLPDDPLFGAQWALQKIGATNAWAVTTGSTNVVVAVIDSGVDYNHEDLAANMWRNPGETGLDANGADKATNSIDDDGNGYVDDAYGISTVSHSGDPMDLGVNYNDDPELYYHGTACAGIIGAVGNNGTGVVGVNWSVQIMGLQIYSGNLDFPTPGIFSATVANALGAYEYVIAMKRRGVNVRVTSNSYVITFYSQAWKDGIDAMGNEGILNVCAAGNHGSSIDGYALYPACFNSSSVVSVAASDPDDALANFSNFGHSTVDLAAPGVDITTTANNPLYYQGQGGTSFAGPYVAGAAALMVAVDPVVTEGGLKAALLGSVDQSSAFRNKVISNGRLNVNRALKQLTNSSPAPIVIWASPANSQTRFDAPVEVTFSKPMDRASVESAITFTPSVAGDFEWSVDSRTVKFRHTDPFLRTNYTCRILGSAVDSAGVTLDGNFNRVSSGAGSDDFTWTFSFPVANDNFADALEITGTSGTLTARNQNATSEFDEPFHAFDPAGQTSLWYRWASDTGGWTTFDASTATTFDSVLAVYTGNQLDALTQVVVSDNYGTKLGSRASFLASTGVTYHIAVTGKFPGSFNYIANAVGQFVLDWYPTPPPGITGVGFSPTSGAAGSTITLLGVNFTGATSVSFNGVNAFFKSSTNLNYTDQQITATVPPEAEDGPLTVRTPHGDVVGTNTFVVLPPPLRVRPTGTETIEIVWPATTPSFVLEETDSMDPGVWSPVAQPLVRTNGQSIFRLDATSGNRFFRLKKQ